jgi:hypothetical protein
MFWRRSVLGTTLRLFLLLLIGDALTDRAAATPDMRFDVVTFCCNCSGSLLCQTQFDHLNFPSVNGHYLAMGTDSNRMALLANGNLLAIYYNSFDADWNGAGTAAQEAATIDQYATNNFTSTGPRPNWVVLNEISAGTWPTNQTYRTWVDTVVNILHTTYGYSVIVYAPFPNPGANSADWQAVSSNAWIGIENYLSGQEIAAQNFSVSWCAGMYQSSIASYNALGVPTSALILGEHFGQTTTGTGYGRSGVSSNNWDSAINARSQAVLPLGFAGYIGYDWGGDTLGVPENEMVHYEDTYAANPLPNADALTAPYPAQQPQSQTVPPGGNASFTVFQAGDAPTTFQWNYDGHPLSGSTSSVLSLTNIGPANAGSYSVLLSNAAGATLSSNALLTVAIPPPLNYEPFAPVTASGGTAFAVGADLIGQTNAAGLTWFQAGPNGALTNQPVIQSGNLDVAGLAFPAGNSVQFGGGGGMAARCQITNGSGITSGSLYYSLLLKITNIAGLSSSGVFWAGFNNSSGNQTTTPSVVATRIYTRAAGGGFNLGLSKASSTSTDWQWDATVHHTNEIIFIVGQYAFNPAATNGDVANLWINPSPASFGLAVQPAATLSASSGPNISSSIIASFVLMNRDPTEPAGAVVDELRIGASWASVTPPAGPAPVLSIAQIGGNIILSWPTNATGFSLHSTSNLATPNAWPAVSSPVNIIGGQYTVTNPLPPGTEFFRLQLP